MIDGRFVEAAPNEFRFETGEYDHALALVVDPRIFGRRFGGGMIDSPSAVTVINSDEFAIAGTTDSADFMQSLPTSTPSGRNGFVLHLRGLGASPPQFEVANELVFGGAGDDAAIDIIRGPRSPIFGGTEIGQVVIGGYTDSADFMFGSPQGGTLR